MLIYVLVGVIRSRYLCICVTEHEDTVVDPILQWIVWQDALDNESFENYKSGLVGKLLEKDPSLSYETNRFWGQIVDKRYAILMPIC